jgi:hypothetical protein
MLGWESMVGEVEVVSIPGDHRVMIESPALVAKLSAAILRAQGQGDDIDVVLAQSAAPTGEAESASAVAPVDRDDPRATYLRTLWKELLGVDVDIDDNFFELGGNSMLAVQMSSRVARDTGVRIQLMRLAVLDLAQVAADLPQTFGREETGGVGARMARQMKRLLRTPGTVE